MDWHIVLTHTRPVQSSTVQYSTVQYSPVQYGLINMQVSTHRDQCTLVGSIYKDAHVLKLDNRAWISTVQYSTVQCSTVQALTLYDWEVTTVKGHYSTVQHSTVQYSTVRYGSINRQVSTHRDQCNQLGSIYRDAHVLELDNRACIRRWTDILYWHIHVQYSTVQYSTVQ